MTFTDDLKRSTKAQMRGVFDDAVSRVQSEWDSAPDRPKGGPDSLPRRTGRLRSGLRWRNRSVTSDVFRITVELEAINNGTDYASVLNSRRRIRIRAKNAKALRWFGPDGNPVFAKSVDYENRWYGWWDIWWRTADNRSGGGRWFDALDRAVASAGRA